MWWMVATMTDGELFEAFAEYQRGRAFSVHTVIRRRRSLASFARHMAPASVTTATAVDVEEWLRRLRAPRTRHAYRSDLASFFRWAQRRELVTSNPMPLVDPVKVPKALPKPAPVEAIAAALATASGDVQLAILLGALAGLRRSEIAALERQDFHLEAVPPVLVVRNGKGGKDRVVPVHPLIAERVQGVTGWLFPSPVRSGPVGSDHLGARIAVALSASGQHVTAHQLRHYFGTEVARATAGNLVLVGQLMGHESPTTTAGYVAWTGAEGAAAVAGLAGFDEVSERRRRRSA